MKHLKMVMWVFLAAVLIAPTITISSQGTTTCAGIVQLALDTTDQLCDTTGRNQACYGHILIDAQSQSGVENFSFSEPGDFANLLDLQSLRLSALDDTAGVWGVALLNIQTHMLYASPQDVMFLLFGDVEIENQTQAPTLLDVTVASTGYINVRLGPSSQAGVVGTLAPDQTVTANGRLADSSWLRVELPDTDRIGWLSGALVTSADDIETLDVVEAWAPYYGPMQAVYFQSGVENPLCVQAPPDGLLIQTPEGVAEVTLLMNEVSIQLSATAFMEAQPGGEMTVTVVEGWATVEAGGVQRTVFAGTQVSIPLNDNLSPSAPPGPTMPYDEVGLQALPVGNLGQVVELPGALSLAEIARRLDALTTLASTASAPEEIDPPEESAPEESAPEESAPEESAPEDNGATPEDDGSSTEEEDGPPDSPPGLDGVLPPGQGGDNPGQGGTPPGQAK